MISEGIAPAPERFDTGALHAHFELLRAQFNSPSGRLQSAQGRNRRARQRFTAFTNAAFLAASTGFQGNPSFDSIKIFPYRYTWSRDALPHKHQEQNPPKTT
ncbi:hypothetical protein ACU8KH_03800 [Lachancea thermotolerans]